LITTEEIFDILLLVAVALIFARILGHFFYKFKQPVVTGEIIAGVILGWIIINFFSGQHISLLDQELYLPLLNSQNYYYNTFEFLAEIGILFLLFISGLEISIVKLKKMGKSSTLVAIGGVVFPLVFGIIAARLLNLDLQTSVLIGLILTATSVGVTARALLDLGVIDSDASTTILGAAVIDDVIAIILLAFVMGIEKSLYDVAWVGIKVAIFFLIFLILGLKVIDKILVLGEKIHLPKAFLSISLAILLIYSFFADRAGISGIIGAFVAGLLIGQNVRSTKISDEIKTIGYGLFIPIFFVWIGTRIWSEGTSWQKDSIMIILELSVVMIVVGIIGKLIGSGLGAKLSGLTNRQSLQIGVGMIPRMELALIISTAAISRNLIEIQIAHYILTATILLTLFTTILTPFLIKATFKNE
jgi:Kef-type K+ transport system membrane component KefB